jgi:dihydrofolate reductase
VDPRSHRPADGPDAIVFDELMATGAVIVGRRTFEMAGQWDGDHHDGVPIFVMTHTAPDEPAPGHATYVTDGVESCVTQAKAAAGDRDILLHGAALAQAFLRAGVLDEMSLQVVPVLLGQGRRLFDDLTPDHIELELVRVLEGDGALSLRYHVRSDT